LNKIFDKCEKTLKEQTEKAKKDKIIEYKQSQKKKCLTCDNMIVKEAKVCQTCSQISQRIVKDRPSKEELLKMVEETSYVAVGRTYGVSDNTIRKWIKNAKD
jgi:uncharacterized protein YjcR